eukprot:scaffold240_cov243-Pinguiococcus_pyrenoidosus.AAC.14
MDQRPISIGDVDSSCKRYSYVGVLCRQMKFSALIGPCQRSVNIKFQAFYLAHEISRAALSGQRAFPLRQTDSC